MGLRSYPCTHHLWANIAWLSYRCKRCGCTRQDPLPPSARSKPRRHRADAIQAAKALVSAMRAAANPPKAALPRDPARRTSRWSYNAGVWEACKKSELDRAMYDAYDWLRSIKDQPGYCRRDRRQAKRIWDMSSFSDQDYIAMMSPQKLIEVADRLESAIEREIAFRGSLGSP